MQENESICEFAKKTIRQKNNFISRTNVWTKSLWLAYFLKPV